MNFELPDLDIKQKVTSKDFDRTISRLKSTLNSFQGSNPLLSNLKQKNKELASLIDNYTQKSELTSLSSNYKTITQNLDKKEAEFDKKEDSIDSSMDLLINREQILHEGLEDFEHKKLLLETKERIISEQITSERDPRIIKIINLLNFKISEFEQEKSVLKSKEFMLKDLYNKNKDAESNLLSERRILLNKRQQSERDLMLLKSRITDSNLKIQSLDQKKLDLDLLIKERTQLVHDLDRQYYDSKSELGSIKTQINSERKVLERAKSDIDEEYKKLNADKALFEEQKIIFNEKMRAMSKQSKQDLDAHKRQILGNIQEKSVAFDEKFKDLEVREKMLLKLESELKRREENLSSTISKISHESSKLKEKEVLIDKKIDLINQKETDIKAYEDEVSTLERTVFDLKSIIEKKDQDLNEKESRLNLYSKELHLAKTTAKLKKDFLPLVEQITSSLQNNDILKAKADYSKLNYLFKSAPEKFQSENYLILKNLYGEIKDRLKQNIATPK